MTGIVFDAGHCHISSLSDESVTLEKRVRIGLTSPERCEQLHGMERITPG